MKTLFSGLLALQVIFFFAFTSNANSEEKIQEVNLISSYTQDQGLDQYSFVRNHPIQGPNRIRIPSYEEGSFGSASPGAPLSGQDAHQQNRLFVSILLFVLPLLFLIQLIHF
jgi:hypothetical protein